MTPALTLRVKPLQFEFRALDPVSFPSGTAANVFRGAFGDILRRVSPETYERTFEPRAGGDPHPSGFENLPRPFVLRAVALDGKQFGAGDRFTLDVNIFDPELPALDSFSLAFEQLKREGLGPGRPRVELLQATEAQSVSVDLVPTENSVGRIRVTFLTPTELKSGGHVLREPAFDALIARARDRVTGLISLYQPSDSPLKIDFRGIGERAAAIRMTAGSFLQNEAVRRSSRTGQTHGLGGFTGEATYEGGLTEFLPYLNAAWWTGVGRLTVWGNGWIETTIEPRIRQPQPVHDTPNPPGI